MYDFAEGNEYSPTSSVNIQADWNALSIWIYHCPHGCNDIDRKGLLAAASASLK